MKSLEQQLSFTDFLINLFRKIINQILFIKIHIRAQYL